MKTFFRRNVLVCAALAVLSCTGLGAAWGSEEARRAPQDVPPPNSGERSLPFVILEARASGRPFGEVRQLLTSESAYRAYVGSPPPAGLDFRREWVVLYAAGTQSTGGYMAQIAYIGRSQDGLSFTIRTRLVAPGPNCFVTQALTHPYVLARFPRPDGAGRVLFEHETVVRDCAVSRE